MKNRIRVLALLVCLSTTTAYGQADEEAVADEAADEEAQSLTERALEELQQRYDDLTESDLDAPVEWAQEDIENIGDWEYKIIEIDKMPAEELEAMLNELGNDRWEVIWIDPSLTGMTIYLKKPSISLISKIPLSQLGRLLLGGQNGQ